MFRLEALGIPVLIMLVSSRGFYGLGKNICLYFGMDSIHSNIYEDEIGGMEGVLTHWACRTVRRSVSAIYVSDDLTTLNQIRLEFARAMKEMETYSANQIPLSPSLEISSDTDVFGFGEGIIRVAQEAFRIGNTNLTRMILELASKTPNSPANAQVSLLIDLGDFSQALKIANKNYSVDLLYMILRRMSTCLSIQECEKVFKQFENGFQTLLQQPSSVVTFNNLLSGSVSSKNSSAPKIPDLRGMFCGFFGGIIMYRQFCYMTDRPLKIAKLLVQQCLLVDPKSNSTLKRHGDKNNDIIDDEGADWDSKMAEAAKIYNANRCTFETKVLSFLIIVGS